MSYFNDFLILTPMPAFRGHFEAVRGNIMLGSSCDFLRNFLSDPFVKEFQLFPVILLSQFHCICITYGAFHDLKYSYQ